MIARERGAGRAARSFGRRGSRVRMSDQQRQTDGIAPGGGTWDFQEAALGTPLSGIGSSVPHVAVTVRSVQLSPCPLNDSATPCGLPSDSLRCTIPSSQRVTTRRRFS